MAAVGLKRFRDEQGYRATVWSGVVLGLIALVDLRWAAYAGALWAAYSIYLFGVSIWGGWHENAIRFWKGIGNWCLITGVTIFLALGIAAPQLIPLMEYSSLTTRSLLTPEDNLAFSLPLERLINLFFPDIGGYAEFAIYPGALVLLLFVSAIIDKSIWKKKGFWFAAFAVSGIYAVGDAFVLNHLIAGLPGFSLLRVPSRALFISNISVIVIICDALSGIFAEGRFPAKQKKIKILISAMVVMLAVMLTIGLRIMVGEIPFEMVYGSIMLVLAFVLIILLMRGVLRKHVGIAVLVAFLVLDMGTVNRSSMAFWTFDKAVAQGAETAMYLAEQNGMFRVYSPSYSIPQHTAAVYGLELVDGIDPLQLQVYSNYMEDATGWTRRFTV